MSLQHLLLPPPPPGEIFRIPAEHWNELVAEVQRRVEIPGIGMTRPPRPFAHHFKVRASRWEGGDADRDWRLDITPGCVNDQMAAIPYRRQDDPRGWTIPQDHPEKSSTRPVIDRSLLEVDPPFLVVSAPPAGAASSEDFEPVTARPPFFQTEERIDRPLFLARVMISAEPSHIPKGLEVANLKRFRLFAGRRPTTARSVAAGYAEIAKLYLLRGDEPTQDELHIQQLEFWCLGAIDNQPQSVIPDDYTTGIGLSDLLLGLIRQQEAELLDAAGAVEFWSQ